MLPLCCVTSKSYTMCVFHPLTHFSQKLGTTCRPQLNKPAEIFVPALLISLNKALAAPLWSVPELTGAGACIGGGGGAAGFGPCGGAAAAAFATPPYQEIGIMTQITHRKLTKRPYSPIKKPINDSFLALIKVQWECLCKKGNKTNMTSCTYCFAPNQPSCVICFDIDLEVSEGIFKTFHPLNMCVIPRVRSKQSWKNFGKLRLFSLTLKLFAR